MLLESIKLHNFRQYKETSLDFAQDIQGKNVTIIIGENGSGKTTFLQSFFWCLYGITYFKDPVVLNKDVATNMTPSFPEDVFVELKLQHGNNKFRIKRIQQFEKDNSNNIRPKKSLFEIKKKDEYGNTSYVDATKREHTINNILRKELARYFFFDGERIETMGKEISGYKKTEEFAEAVEGLLGLKGMQKALEHLSGGTKNSVIGKYNQRYDVNSDSEVKKLTDEINDCNDKIEAYTDSMNEKDAAIRKAEELRDQKAEELKEYESSKALQERKEQLQKVIKRSLATKADAQKEICRAFNNQASSFLTLKLIKDAYDILVKLKISGSDIPSITDKTIQYLIDHGECLCGRHLPPESVELEYIKKWFDVLPPKSIGNMVNDFKMTARNRIGSLNDFIDVRDGKLARISECDEEILNAEDEIQSAIDSKLNGIDVEEIVRTISSTIAECERCISRDNQEIRELSEKIGAEKAKKESAELRLKEHALKSKTNRKIEIYKAYAMRINQLLSDKYAKSEKEVRSRLVDNMNEIFSKINNGDLSVRINEKYQIDVVANNVNAKVETSEGQSISVIFSFITSMIKMSQENRLSDDRAKQELSSDIYPLVMDAPLSKFDKKHIQSVCETIPHLTEQVVIFIKDTDGDLAKEYMNDKIGKSHKFVKISETETIIE